MPVIPPRAMIAPRAVVAKGAALALGAAFALGVASGCSGEEAGVVTESTRARLDRRLPESAICDGKRVRLRGARGEILGVQVRAPRGTRVTLRVASGARVDGFVVRALTVREPSTDMYGPSRGAGAYPDLLEPSPQADVTSLDGAYFDVAIARDAAPGRVEGELRIGARRLPVELTIEKAAIDLEPAPLVWAFYLPREIARLHGTQDDDGPVLLEHERRYVELVRAHGAYLASDQPAERVRARTHFMHGVRYWPVSFELTSDQTIAEGARAAVELFRKSPVRPIVTPVDEPNTSADRARTRHACQVVRDVTHGEVLCAVTAAPHPELDGPIDIYFSPEAAGKPVPAGARALTYNGRPPRAGNMVLDAEDGALRSWGWLAYRYRLDLWYAWEALYVRDRYNAGKDAPMRLPENPLNFDERHNRKSDDHGNLEGLLVYPGPRPSLRLKTLRRGLQDRLLLLQLEACDPARAAELVRATVARGLAEVQRDGTPAWPADERGWEAARHRVLDALAECP